jgi:preprotein translocase subunit SecG
MAIKLTSISAWTGLALVEFEENSIRVGSSGVCGLSGYVSQFLPRINIGLVTMFLVKTIFYRYSTTVSLSC